MLECWNENSEDRPTFTELKEKFETLLLAGKEGFYIDLQVDEMKPYYVIKDEEEKKRPRLRAASDTVAMKKIKLEKEKEGHVAGRYSFVEGPTHRPQEAEPVQPLEKASDQPLSQLVPRQDERPSIAKPASQQSQHEALERPTTTRYVDHPRRAPVPEEREMILHAETSLDDQTKVGGESASYGDITVEYRSVESPNTTEIF